MKVNPVFATGISVTVEPIGKIERQIPVFTPLVMVQATPPGELDTDPLPVPEPASTVTAPGTATRYFAWTDRDAERGTTQLPEPVQAPTQFRKTLPGSGACVTVTLVLSANAVLHVPVADRPLSAHESPDGALVSVPPPSVPVAAESVNVGGAVNCAVTLDVTPVVSGTVHVLPEQAPLNPLNDARPDGVALSVTTVPGGNVVAHVPPATPDVTVHEIPDGTLVTSPLPVPPPLTATPCV